MELHQRENTTPSRFRFCLNSAQSSQLKEEDSSISGEKKALFVFLFQKQSTRHWEIIAAFCLFWCCNLAVIACHRVEFVSKLQISSQFKSRLITIIYFKRAKKRCRFSLAGRDVSLQSCSFCFTELLAIPFVPSFHHALQFNGSLVYSRC